jgi:predicted nucleotidyltransferase
MNPELQRIIETLRSLEKEVREKYKVDIIGIFGSWTTEKQTEKSDVDILIRLIEPIGLKFLSFNAFAEEYRTIFYFIIMIQKGHISYSYSIRI